MMQTPKERLSRTSMSLAVMSVFTIFVFPVILPYLQKQFGETLYKTYGITFEELMNQLGIPYTPAM